MSKSKKINFIVNLQVYPFDVMVSIGQSDKQLEESLSKYGVVLREEGVILYSSDKSPATAIQLSGGAMIIRLRKLPSSPKDYGDLAHETFHIVTFVLEEVGVKYSYGVSDEAYAYLITFLTENIYKQLNKYY